MTIDSRGMVTGMSSTASEKNYHYKDRISPIMSVWMGGKAIMPRKAKFDSGKNVLTLAYPGDVEANILVQQKESHLVLELLYLSKETVIDLISWGPYPTTLGETIGETVGVTRGDDFALGLQSLNAKTLGGYPWNDNDAMPQLDIFESGNYSDMSEEGKRQVLYRVEAAKPEDFGSSLQAYTRNRNKRRIIKNWGKEQYVAEPFNDGGLAGSKIALFGVAENDALETIGKIEVAEGLPHPMIDGKWGKVSRSASGAYIIMDFSEKNIDRAIAYTKQAGLKYLYHGGPFKNWGHFELLEESFPNGWMGMKKVVEKAEANGLHVGVHTLSNFITTKDPYVTPVPDPRLAKVGSSKLFRTVNIHQKEIPIVSPDFFKQMKNNNLKTVQVGDELIQYGSVSAQEPWKLLDCQRGAFGTKVAVHKQGDRVSLLADHGYKVFLTNSELTEEIAKNIADLYNQTGLRQISFDGLEGNRSTAMGNYGEILFTYAWYNNLSENIKRHYIADASRTAHYFWHIYTRMNWGEPWYADFRESQTEYRLKNQKYFKRNYMPGMLGWFSMRPTTSIEDIEWMLARSAAFNAGYAFVTGFEALEKNGYTEEILEAINEWEKARMANVFNLDQQARMEDINNEFHLEKISENIWNLYQVYSYKFKHEKKVKQPGKPLYSVFNFENPVEQRTLNFILTAVGSNISGITIKIDNYNKVNLPIILKAGQTVKYTGGDKALVYNENWKKIRNITIDESLLKIVPAGHILTFDCQFSGNGNEPQAKLELRIVGNKEAVTT